MINSDDMDTIIALSGGTVLTKQDMFSNLDNPEFTVSIAVQFTLMGLDFEDSSHQHVVHYKGRRFVG